MLEKMSGQLLISGLIEHAEKYHSDAEIVSRTVGAYTQIHIF